MFPSWWLKRKVISWLLWPFSLVFGVIVYIRRVCYRKGIFHTYSSNLPVIVVGNISVGGTGKTPFVITLANELKKHGYRPAIVSRGYRSQSKKFPFLINANTPVELAGDEPLIIARQTQCLVVIDPKRVRAVKFLEENKQCDIIICDDGLQHYALNRNVEIIVVDSERQFGNGFLLPAGMLREPVSRLSEAAIVVSNGEMVWSDKQLPKIVCTMQYQIKGLRSVSDPEQFLDILSFQHKQIHAVAGIGNPERFFSLLKDNHLSVIPHAFPDHHAFTPSDFVFDQDKNLPIIMTEKDAVKCTEFSLQNAWYLEINAVLSGERALFSMLNLGTNI